VRVIPRAGRSGFAGLRDDALLVRLAAAPVDGAANDELIALIAKTLRIPKRDITIVAGERSRSKRVRVAGVSREDAYAAVQENAMKVWRGEGRFIDFLKADARVTLPADKLEDLFDLGYHTKHVDTVFARVFGA
jgi:uncharacterized protein (TIGR00251 family)